MLGREQTQLLNQPRGPYPSHTEMTAMLDAAKGWVPECHRRLWDGPVLNNRTEALLKEHDSLLSDVSVRGLERLADLAREHGLEVVIVLNACPQAERTEQAQQVLERIEAGLRGVVGDRPGVELFSPFIRYRPTEQFAKRHHLTAAGAEGESRLIAEQLAER